MKSRLDLGFVAQPRNVHRLHLAVLATMRPALDPAGHREPRMKPTCLLHTWRPHRQRPFVLVLHLHQHKSSHNLHLQYLAKNQSTQCCQSLITEGSDHPPVLEPHMVLIRACREALKRRTRGGIAWLASGGRGVRQRHGRLMAKTHKHYINAPAWVVSPVVELGVVESFPTPAGPDI
jgi:hypothetical protein